MTFKWYAGYSEIDVIVKTTNGEVVDVYESLEDLRWDLGEDSVWSEVLLDNIAVYDFEGNELRFDDIKEN